jgi:hypothetical protein
MLVSLKQLMRNNSRFLHGHGCCPAGFRGALGSARAEQASALSWRTGSVRSVNLWQQKVDRECVRDYCKHENREYLLVFYNIFIFLFEVE